MSTTIHIPPELLEAVDARAKALKLSRNRFIIDALNTVINQKDSWSPEFLAALDSIPQSDEPTVDKMLANIKGRRSSKKPIEL